MAGRIAHAAAIGLLVLVLVGCASTTPLPSGVTVADAHRLSVVAEGFSGPTQLSRLPDGDLVVAELNGAEGDAAGRVVRIASGDWGDRQVLQTGLDKPTGVAAIEDSLWIMERRRLSVTTLDAGAPRTAVLDEMPYNGRSQGTLTVTPDDELLYDTSGSKRGAEVRPGSGGLWVLGGADDAPRQLASGLKHGYAHTFSPDDELFVTEMSDGQFDGQEAADELVRVRPGDDLGWPRCVGDNRPVAEYGVVAQDCADIPGSHALFAPHATPTDVVVAPWDLDLLLVTLWVPGEVVAVPRSPGPEPHLGTVVVAGLESPQSMLVDTDCVLLVDHGTGDIFRLCGPSPT